MLTKCYYAQNNASIFYAGLKVGLGAKKDDFILGTNLAKDKRLAT